MSIEEGPGKRRRIALTFDADMTPEMLEQLSSGQVASWYDEAVVDVLRDTRTQATLFISGLWAETYPGRVRRLARSRLFELGNHTWDHRAWTSDCYGLPAIDDRGEKRREVIRTARVLERLTGKEPFWFRFPGLCATEDDLRLVSDLGEQPVGGQGSGDAFQRDAGVIVNTVLSQVRPGSIVVMHMMGGPNAPATGEALKTLIPALRERGYRLVTLSRLLRPTRTGARAGR